MMFKGYNSGNEKKRIKNEIEESIREFVIEREIKIDEFQIRVGEGERVYSINRLEKIERILKNNRVCKSCQNYLKSSCEFNYYLFDICEKADLKVEIVDIIKSKYHIKKGNSDLIGEFTL